MDLATGRPLRALTTLLKRPLTHALLFEAMLIPLALGLGWLLNLAPWQALLFSVEIVVVGALATVPLLVLFSRRLLARFQWAQELERTIQRLLLPFFRDAGPLAVALVAALAGLGEELLFRGVIQAGLTEWLGPTTGLLLASLAFGLAHSITPAYLVLATLMGLYMGLLYQWSDNLLLPVIVHALYDWIAIRHYQKRAEGDPAW